MNKIRYFLLFLIIGVIITGCTDSPKVVGMPNPWIDCEQSLECADKKAGFAFPVEFSTYKVRAMKDMIEIESPLDKERTVTIRKSTKYNRNEDISGDYNIYPEDKEIYINNVRFRIRGENCKDKIHIVNFASPKAYYAIMSKNDLNTDDIRNLYEIIKKADKL